jgi:hypothetical protein
VSWQPLLHLPDEHSYRERFNEEYVNYSPLVMHDGMRVMFYPEMFDHAFFQDTDRGGRRIPPVFSLERAERLLWIQGCLTDPSLPSYRRVMANGEVRRLILVESEQYLVVLRGVRGLTARFLTAYVADASGTVAKIKANPIWQ